MDAPQLKLINIRACVIRECNSLMSASIVIIALPLKSGSSATLLVPNRLPTLTAMFLALCTTACNAAAVQLSTTGPIELTRLNDATLRDLRITSTTGNCILLRECRNVIIEHCELGPAVGEAVHLVACTSVTIRNCYASSVRTGVYAVDCAAIKIENCRFRNMNGPMPRGQMVQFDKVRGAGSRITSNTLVNEPGRSNPEDAISIYMSAGTAESPILVAGNCIFGGGPSRSGGGIMLGDSGGEHIIARENKLYDPGQYGIAVSCGKDIQLMNNTIYGRQQAFTNVGLYVWNQYNVPCGQITVRGNRVNWTRHDGAKSSAWNANNCGEINGWNENDWNAEIPPATPPELLPTQ